MNKPIQHPALRVNSERGKCKIIVGDARQMDMGQFERYGVIIADPPWPYDNPKSHRPRLGGYTYQPMTIEEICAMPLPLLAACNCILFLWGTWPKVPQAVQVMQVWGFEHVTGFPWNKITKSGRPRYGIGHWIANCSEYVLIGRRGKVSPPRGIKYLGLVGPAFKHSRKPDAVHDIAEQLPGPYLELFARRPRPGWTVFGNEFEES
jgi:N6-adenosine-specific RNA methylase IME4